MGCGASAGPPIPRKPPHEPQPPDPADVAILLPETAPPPPEPVEAPSPPECEAPEVPRDPECVQLIVKRGADVDGAVVKNLVKPWELPEELKLQAELLSVPAGIDCFRCGGRGTVDDRRSVIRTIGKVASLTLSEELPPEGATQDTPEAAEEVVRSLTREASSALASVPSAGLTAVPSSALGTEASGSLEDNRPSILWEGGSLQEGEVRWLYQDGRGWGLFDDVVSQKLDEAYLDGRGAVLTVRGPRFWYRVDLDSMIQVNVTTKMARKVFRLTHDNEPVEEAERDLPQRKCWVCCGTGKVSEWHSGLKYRRRDDESKPCLVCYGDSQYGLSTECDHYYCADCIGGSLKGILEAGQFPAFCPQCRADAGGAPEIGRIESAALTFLQQRGVIDRELQFRFLRLQEQMDDPDGYEERPYFACPGKCGNFVLEKDPSYDGKWGEKYTKEGTGRRIVRLGQCVCGSKICRLCQNLEEGPFHICPKDPEPVMDAETMKLLAEISKKCPKCGNYIQKNEGCHIMMCGTTAHGKLLDCIRNGGCCCNFDWNTMQPLPDSFIDLDDQKKGGPCVTARQIKGHPKCARPDCQYFMTVDACGGNQAKNGGEEYCCAECKTNSGSHGQFCHKILWTDQWKGPE